MRKREKIKDKEVPWLWQRYTYCCSAQNTQTESISLLTAATAVLQHFPLPTIVAAVAGRRSYSAAAKIHPFPCPKQNQPYSQPFSMILVLKVHIQLLENSPKTMRFDYFKDLS